MQSVTQTISVTYEAASDAPARARAAAAEFAGNAGATARQVDSIRLAVSEAVTNAVLHAYRGKPGEIHVTAARAGSELWILIADHGGGMRPEADRPGLGLGLGLISQVCDDMAIVPRSSGGTEVRILFKLASADQPGPASADRPGPASADRPGPASADRPGPASADRPGPASADRPAEPQAPAVAPAAAEMAVGIPDPLAAVPAAPLHD